MGSGGVDPCCFCFLPPIVLDSPVDLAVVGGLIRYAHGYAQVLHTGHVVIPFPQ